MENSVQLELNTQAHLPRGQQLGLPCRKRLRPELRLASAIDEVAAGEQKLTRNHKRASFVEVTRKQVQPVSLHTR